ncbi:MAG: dockerin type I domain-containing protein, partial [Planctomycetota bacterium]
MQARAQVLSMVMVLFFGLTSFTHADSATFLRGDLDGDGEVTLRDIHHAVDYWYGQQTVEVIEATDVNNDGCFNSLDVAGMIDQVFFDVGRSPVAERVIFTRGDVDADGAIGVSDLIALISYLRGDCSPYEILDAMD